MMLICSNLKTLFYIYLFIISIYFIENFNLKPKAKPKPKNENDPFNALGIPDLNPKALLMEIDQENNKNKPKKETLRLKTIDDLPNFLQKSNLSEDEGIKVLTRFLIQDDLTLKKYGVVYDQTGFDGLPTAEPLAPIGTDERLTQRARSAANIWFKSKYAKLDYDAYGAENIMDEIVPNWRIFKVLMIGKNGESTFVKICLPLDESETALGSDKDDPCGPRTQFVEKEKSKNEAYISQIRSKKFFRRGTGITKLLPGEKMIVKESSNKTLVLDSHNIEEKLYGNNNYYNPPSLDQNMNDALLDAYQRKTNIQLPENLRNFYRSPYQNQAQNFPKIVNNSPNYNALVNSNQFPNNLNSNFPNFNQNYNNFNSNLYSNSNALQQYSVKNFDLINRSNINSNFLQQSNDLNNFSQFNINSKSNIKTISPQDFKKPTDFKFKETQGFSDNNSLSVLENELSQMRKQLNEMMTSLKEKDLIIKEQNTKLSQFINPISKNIPHSNNLNNPNVISSNFQFRQNQLGFNPNIPQMNPNIYNQDQFGGPVYNQQVQSLPQISNQQGLGKNMYNQFLNSNGMGNYNA